MSEKEPQQEGVGGQSAEAARNWAKQERQWAEEARKQAEADLARRDGKDEGKK